MSNFDPSKLSGLPDESKIKKKSKEIVKSNDEKPSRGNQRLVYEIDPERDDFMVRIVKAEVNKQNLMSSDVYNAFEDNGEAYNLIYGLRVRNSMSTKMFLKWCHVLNVEPVLELHKIEE
jgi:hypothetical protein